MTTIDPPPQDDPARATLQDASTAVLEAASEALGELAAEAEMVPLDNPRRLLLVHAHPDDETIGTGATMAKYAAEGTLVTLVTCTRGEEGEVLVPELAELAADRTDKLGEHRVGELAAACEALGVADHRFLGGPGRYRDSGMAGTPANHRPNVFCNADLDEAAGSLVAVIREMRPQVVVTYDPNGGYGHPDHIRAHQVTVAAVAAAGDAARYPDAGVPWSPVKFYYAVVPKSFIQASLDYFREHSDEVGFFEAGVERADDVPFGVPDEQVTTEIDARDQLPAKTAALRAHKTQVALNGPFFALADGVGRRALGREHYVLVSGERGPGTGPHGWESDLFAGLDQQKSD